MQSLEVVTLPGITTHKAVDMIISTTTTGPPTKKLKMPTHAAELFEAKILEEVALTNLVDTTAGDLSSEINALEITIAKCDAELLEASAKRSTEAANFEKEATLLANVAEQDGEFVDEDWSLDAAIAAKNLHELRLTEQLAIHTYDTEDATTNKLKVEAITKRNVLINKLATYDLEHPDPDTDPPPENKIRNQHKKALHNAMDVHLATRTQRLKNAVANKDTQQMWILITASIEAGFVDYFSLTGKEADRMKGRSKVRTTTSTGGSPNQKHHEASKEQDGKHSRETAASKRIREVKRRADHTRAQANRLTNIARDIHANNAASSCLQRGPLAPWDNARSACVHHTALAYRKQAIEMGYSHTHLGTRKKDAEDGGQEILSEFLAIDL